MSAFCVCGMYMHDKGDLPYTLPPPCFYRNQRAFRVSERVRHLFLFVSGVELDEVRLLLEHLVPGCVLGKSVDLSCNHVSQRNQECDREPEKT